VVTNGFAAKKGAAASDSDSSDAETTPASKKAAVSVPGMVSGLIGDDSCSFV
jgi:hypothetical protein